jgi:3-phosphoshikimate 1-carboxyvinyltransferase
VASLTEPLRVSGRVKLPGDKSISHRALILAAIGAGRSEITHLLGAADIRSMQGALEQLGVEIEQSSDCVTVHGVGGRLKRSGQTLDCGNSGTTARLMSGVVAGSGIDATLIGDESLTKRPMRRVAEPLQAMGARVEVSTEGGLPMTVHGAQLRDTEWNATISSAQVKSAVLLAGLLGGVRVVHTEPVLSRDHTERMLAARGAVLKQEDRGRRVTLEKGHELAASDMRIPGDPSSAAFLAGLAAVADDGELKLEGICLNPTRTGAFSVLGRMGARVSIDLDDIEGGEPYGDVVVRNGALHGTRVVAHEVPSLVDELPLIACVAAMAEGETIISGAGELRVKESDRISTVVEGLRAIGADAEELPEGIRVVGRRRGDRKPLRGRVRTEGDHRIAMAFGVLSAVPGNAIIVDDPACVSISYPDFWRDIATVRR